MVDLGARRRQPGHHPPGVELPRLPQAAARLHAGPPHGASRPRTPGVIPRLAAEVTRGRSRAQDGGARRRRDHPRQAHHRRHRLVAARHRREGRAGVQGPRASRTAPPATRSTTRASTSSSSAAATRPSRSRCSSPSSRRRITIVHQFAHAAGQQARAGAGVRRAEDRVPLRARAARVPLAGGQGRRRGGGRGPRAPSANATLDCDGVFVFAGMRPNLEGLGGRFELDHWGYVKVDDEMRTNVPGRVRGG